MTEANTGEHMVNGPPNTGKSFFGGSEKAREKNFIFAVDASKSETPTRQNPLNRRNQAIEAFEASQTNNFSNNYNHYYYYYWYHSVNNTQNDHPQKSSVVPRWYQGSCEEVGA